MSVHERLWHIFSLHMGTEYATIAGMSDYKRFKLVLFVVALAFPFAILACAGDDKPATGGDAKVGQDSSSDRGTVRIDTGAKKDTGTKDRFIWPDSKADSSNPTGDAWQWPDLYTGTPFGCQTNADCFGKTCCPTPWGVKVCADRCDSK
jgi:hypothetical protein